MSNQLPVLFLFFFALPAFAQAPVAAPNPIYADIILKNGKIAGDRDSGKQWYQALSIREGNILSIGTDKAIEKEKGPATRLIDLRGRVVLPGFNDAHVHFLSGGLALSRVELGGATSIYQLQEKLKAYASANPLKRWILGQSWDQSNFKEPKFPSKEDIDVVVNDRPVMLWHSDQHTLLLNSKALETLRITSSTSDPKNGEIRKNEKGEPTGILLENAAIEVARRIDNPSGDELRQAFTLAQEQAVKFGVTSIQGGPIRGEEELRVLEELYAAKQLNVRYALWGDLEKPQEFLALKEKHKNLPEEWVKFDAVKGYIDGVLGARTAALLEPYSDDPKNSGTPLYTQDRLNELVLNANRLGLPVALHAIGDRAVSMAVTAIVTAKKQLFNSRLRNRIEHAEIVPPYIYQKFADGNIIASVQPSHLVYDTEAQSYNDARLGPQRVKHAFAIRNFLNAHAHVAFGTDWPVESLNPMIGLYAATTRQHYDGRPLGGWQPSQKVTLEQAIEAYTIGSAYATREDHVKGTLREGKYADLVVLETDPFSHQGKALLKIPVYLTISGGKILYDASTPQIKAQ